MKYHCKVPNVHLLVTILPEKDVPHNDRIIIIIIIIILIAIEPKVYHPMWISDIIQKNPPTEKFKPHNKIDIPTTIEIIDRRQPHHDIVVVVVVVATTTTTNHHEITFREDIKIIIIIITTMIHPENEVDET